MCPAEFESGFFYKDPAWHKMGKTVQNVLTAEEAIVEAGLDWEVTPVPVYHKVNGMFYKIKDRQAMERSTDHKVLSIMGMDYQPLQNRKGFQFFDDVVATKEAKYHTAGSLMGGKVIWILAKVNGGNGHLNIKGDVVDKYLLLTNSHDGSTRLKMFFTPIRVVCWNTLSMAVSSAVGDQTFAVRHVGDIQARIEKAREVLGITIKWFSDFEEKARILAQYQLPPARMPLLLAAAFKTQGAEDANMMVDMSSYSTRRQNQFEEVTNLFEGAGKGLNDKNIKGTKWAAYNAIAEYADYYRKATGPSSDDNRLRSVWMGEGMAMKKRAWNYLWDTMEEDL